LTISGTTSTDPFGTFGIGIAPTAGNGLVQFATGTTKAYGACFGTDLYLYRGASGSLYVDNATGNQRFIAPADAVGGAAVFQRSQTTTSPARFYIDRSAGTLASQTAITAGDSIGQFQFRPYDGTSYLTGAAITAVSDGTVGTNAISTKLVFATAASSTAVARMEISGSGIVSILSDVKLTTVGSGLYVKEGTNATMGVATLVAGTVTVNTTKVTANSRIMLTPQNLGTILRPAAVGVTARTAGTSFVITSSDITDTSTVAWVIVEPA
jgi:hypothetical protein